MNTTKQDFFTSRLALMLSVLGIAIGTGNIWRFPRIIAQNGGGSFIIPWIIFLFTWSIPLIIIEFGIGNKTRSGTAGAFGRLIGKQYLWMGAFVGFCSMAIMFYYSVVMGWCLYYVLATAGGILHNINYEIYWQSFTGSYKPLLFHSCSILLSAGIVYRGISKGIEKANILLIPLLFLIMIFAAFKSIMLPGSMEGVRFLFTPHLSDLLNYRIWLEALTQSAWSTGAGWGLILTYAVYMKQREGIVMNSILTVVGDSIVSLLAALAIIPVIFSVLPHNHVERALESGNTGLTFIWIPQLFEQVQGGYILMLLFFLTLCFAALSSLIAMVELVARLFIDAGITRKKAVCLVGLIGFLCGIPSALKTEFFSNQDWTWGLGLIVNGIFFTYAVLRFGTTRFRRELVNSESCRMNLGRWFDYVVRFIIPLEFVCVITWWFWKSLTVFDPEEWWNPFRTTSLGSCIFQWSIVIAVLLALNRWIGRKMLGGKK
jgi:NSS family neurotransmitter:Na+ symporter